MSALALALASAVAAGATAANDARPSNMRAPTAPRPGGTPVVVTNCNDSGPGSLRDAIASAPGGADVDLSALTCSTISLTSGAITVGQYGLSLAGPGAASLLIDGNGASRIFDHTGYGYLGIYGISLAHGASDGDGGCVRSSGGVRLGGAKVYACHAHAGGETRGGAIYAYAVSLSGVDIDSSIAESDSGYALGGGVYAHRLEMLYSVIGNDAALSHTARGFGGGARVTLELEMDYSTVSGNVAAVDGGVALHGLSGHSSRIVDSTISGNVATEFMGGITTDSFLRVENSTIAFNCAATTQANPLYTAGIGLHFRFTPPELESSIVANNTLCGGRAPQDIPYDISGQLFNGTIAGANNLIMTAAVLLPPDTLRSDPLLQPLRNNGGVTPTHALSPGSPAIDAGNDVAVLDNDQRGDGYLRVIGAAADIGAFEAGDPIFADGFDPRSFGVQGRHDG